MKWVVTADGAPVAVIETVSVELKRFDQIDAEFAFEEGEGDRSLRFWRLTHKRYFHDNGGFAPGMLLWCERFRLIEALDPQLAAEAQQHVAAEERDAAAILAEAPAEDLLPE
jgi:hypothetical protein